jgi:putative hydrolase of the HAD superfamily
MRFETIFFDLDSTLYPESNGLWQAIRQRIDLFMLERMSFPPEEIPTLRQKFFIEHGTTLRGLQAYHQVNPAEYLNFVHDLPLDEYLSPEPKLREILKSISCPCWVFTNSDADHANRVISKLGIEGCFEGMIDVWKMDPHCKPQKEAYQRALDLAGVADPKACALLEDSPRNLAPAKEMGFFTVLVGRNGNPSIADRSVESILDLPRTIPEFWY